VKTSREQKETGSGTNLYLESLTWLPKYIRIGTLSCRSWIGGRMFRGGSML